MVRKARLEEYSWTRIKSELKDWWSTHHRRRTIEPVLKKIERSTTGEDNTKQEAGFDELWIGSGGKPWVDASATIENEQPIDKLLQNSSWSR